MVDKTKALLIAGTASGVGKTTVATGLMAALGKNHKVQPFKVGPDFIDPGHHTQICGRPSRNLDSFMMGERGVLETFARASRGAEYCIIEGVMGLFDGLDATEIASSAHIAKILDVPVLLVINAHGVSRSIAAIVKGFSEFDRSVSIQGIILNNTGSDRHIKLIRDSLHGAGIKIPVIGALPGNKELSIPSRHLGLHMSGENHPKTSERANFIEQHINMDSVKIIAENFKPYDIDLKESNVRFDVKIGIANDRAFCFYYQDTFDSLKISGAELIFFSPMSDRLPDVDGIYLGGGYPELFAKELEASGTRHEIKKAAEDGMPIYGECGALLYLCNSLKTDKAYKMAGVFGASSRMTGKLQGLGYTEAEAIMDSPIAKKGKLIRGHEFHYSITECDRDARLVYRLRRGKGIIEGRDGLIEHNTMASYMHTHPASNSFDEFLRQCSKYKSR
ncbi:MAG: cobyrinic acid a,c-diamide synthase [Candidatus Methanoperedens nitroreducens]|uniref:Cobyrinate a,c-diamide synthase n=1 Tax=Candidatus Methanoperedens nitratireducens TaxID=1392998 RepID=A0A0N8KR21_9EURY|nr:cobyrinate a,c-diamide synthase [Candidatus Methanoperedens sp. BLZ2]KAB2947757.1 MAG: hydrogenobyrinic acid a,c-diamide synthase (glutamine-hydrolyzing) [Candidatus Methanoperedens sp.]KPQ43722.1 MAG: cobyrinic acid a,c-diamide synthase [Candidatus Methanoperedens sp. BLZ1]MBZ0176176.1 hydrogenobyrinic acid a,c-diamide synthase (glutamine-hydrolyzing) [Candidatus Methanoperedens nitroreducens]CAG0998514.1 cobyrinic acid a,c-diamide synthase [Methanosarcinales archaeon]MCX9077402.1 hydrogen